VNLNVLIVEDNEFFMNCNKKYMKQIAKMYEVKMDLYCYACIGEGVYKLIEDQKIDLALLDVEVGNRNGIELGKRLSRMQPFSSIIFVTEYGKYLPEANSIHPTAYLSKPVDFQELTRICYKEILAKVGKLRLEQEQANIITFRTNREPIDIKETEIIYIQKVARRLLVVSKYNKMLISTTLRSVKEQLSDLFVYANRDIIVNRLEVKMLEKNCIVMSNDDTLPISMRSHAELARKIRS